MIQYNDFFTKRIPNILENLPANFSSTNAYLSIADLKKRICSDLFIVYRVLRRFDLTMVLDVNRPSFSLSSYINGMEHLISSAFRSIQGANTEEEITNVLQTLLRQYNEIKDNFNETFSAYYRDQYTIRDFNESLQSSFSNFRQPEEIMNNLRLSNGTQLNVFLPFEEDDRPYLQLIPMLRDMKDRLPVRLYGFSHEERSSVREVYYKYLQNDWTHCDIRYSTFDVSVLSCKSAFMDKQNSFKRALNYVKPGGALMLYAFTYDVLPQHLEKIATQLTHVQVRFFTHYTNAERRCNNDFVLIIGRKETNPDWIATYHQLLAAFLYREPIVEEYMFSGSYQDVSPFRSYDMTREEYMQLLPSLPEFEKENIGMVLPKNFEDTRRPLLPFTPGQLGLVLISGDINGVIEEEESHCRHAVKGFSSRTSTTRTEPVFSANGIQTGRKEITLDFPVTNVYTIDPSGNIRMIGGAES